MFKELWKDLPFGFKAFMVIGAIGGATWLGFIIWAVVSALDIARSAVGG
jgi:hypothetical protein